MGFKARARNNPSGMSRGLQKFMEFHKLEPKQCGEFSQSLVIPPQLYLAGPGKWITYRAAKWENKNHDYIHEFEKGVKVCVTARKGPPTVVPRTIRGSTTLVKLGKCLGFCFVDRDGNDVEAKVSRPPELYTTTSGRALLVVEDKRKLLAVIWGGKLAVEARGIVG